MQDAKDWVELITAVVLSLSALVGLILYIDNWRNQRCKDRMSLRTGQRGGHTSTIIVEDISYHVLDGGKEIGIIKVVNTHEEYKAVCHLNDDVSKRVEKIIKRIWWDCGERDKVLEFKYDREKNRRFTPNIPESIRNL